MALTAEKQMEKVGQTRGCADHDHDLIHELSNRLDAVWRYDQYISNAEGKPEIQQFWTEQKEHETRAISRLKDLVAKEVKSDCF